MTSKREAVSVDDIRALFPQDDHATALIPWGHLSVELFDGALTADEIAKMEKSAPADERAAVEERIRIWRSKVRR